MEEKKSKLGLGILIGVLVTLVIGLSAFIIYDKVLSNDNDNNNNNQQVENNDQTENNNNENNTTTENEQNKEVTVTLTQTEQEKLLNKIDKYNTDIELTKYYPISDVNSLDNSVKLNFLYTKAIDSFGETFTKDNLKTAASNYFYSGFTFTNENIIGSIESNPIYNYNNSTGTYTLNNDYGVIIEQNRSKAYYVAGNYNESTKLYTFDIKVLYGETCSDTCGPSTKFYDDNKLDNVVYKLGDVVEEFDQVYPKVKDKLPITKYSFYKNSNGEFVLKSVK